MLIAIALDQLIVLFLWYNINLKLVIKQKGVMGSKSSLAKKKILYYVSWTENDISYDLSKTIVC